MSENFHIKRHPGSPEPRVRDAIRADIDALKIEEPTISGLEIARRLGAKHGVSGYVIRRML